MLWGKWKDTSQQSGKGLEEVMERGSAFWHSFWRSSVKHLSKDMEVSMLHFKNLDFYLEWNAKWIFRGFLKVQWEQKLTLSSSLVEVQGKKTSGGICNTDEERFFQDDINVKGEMRFDLWMHFILWNNKSMIILKYFTLNHQNNKAINHDSLQREQFAWKSVLFQGVPTMRCRLRIKMERFDSYSNTYDWTSGEKSLQEVYFW